MKTLIASAYLVLAALAAWPAEAPPAEKKPETVLEESMRALETRLQLLEQAMVEKDAKIKELQSQLGERPPVPLVPQAPLGFQFNLGPQDMQHFQQRMEEYLRKNLDGHLDQDLDADDDEMGLNIPPRRHGRKAAPREAPREAPAQKPRLGVLPRDASDELRTRYKNEAKVGAFVTDVTPNSAADKAGLLAGDCIVSFNEKPVRSAQELFDVVREAPEGRFRCVVVRRGEELVLHVLLNKPARTEVRTPEDARGGWLRQKDVEDPAGDAAPGGGQGF